MALNPYELGLREVFDDELEFIIKRAKEYLPHSEAIYGFLVFGFRRKIIDRKVTRMYVPAGKNLPFFLIITNVLLKDLGLHYLMSLNPYELGLREVFDDELEFIIERAKKYLPHSETIYSFLVFGFRRKIVDRKVTRMYVPAGKDLRFFLIITNVLLKPGRQTMTPFWDPNEISTEDVKLLFKSLPNWNWEEVFFVNNASLYPLNQAEKILLGENGLCKNKLCLDRQEGYTYKLADEDNINIKPLDDDIFLSKIDERYAPLVFKYWDYTIDTIEGLKVYMKSFPAVAAFAKKDPSEEPDEWDLKKEENGIASIYKPVCWVICRFHGEIGFTYTLPKFRNRGIASAVTMAVAKEVIKLNLSPYVNIILNNPASEKAHFKAGFKKITHCTYDMYLKPGMSWNDF